MKKITDYAELVKAKHALNKTIAPVEDGASMAGSYTSGKQFIRDSVLYSALTSIAAGTAWSSLTLDTDYEVADDVSTQIAAVNQTLTQKAYQTDDATETALASDDLVPFYDTSATAKKKMSVANLIGQTVSNPNLFDNPWFTVNQRGQASYNTHGSIGYDRWRFYYSSGGGGSVSKSGSVVALQSTGSYVDIVQKLEDTSDLIGKTLTFSMLMSDGTIKSGSALFDGEDVTFYNEQGTLSLDYSKSSSSFRIVVYGSRTVSFKAVKLELGSVSTLAQDTAPNYATELLKCQRYYYQCGTSTGNFYQGIAQAVSQTQAVFNMICPSPFRAGPTITLTQVKLTKDGNATAATSTSASIYRTAPNSNNMQITFTTSGLTVGDNYLVRTESAVIELSAEL